MELFWEISQNQRINQASSAAESASSKINRLEREVKELERRLDRLSLACQALWELNRDQAGITDGELQRRMTEIDLRDGTRDGKIAVTILVCPNCGQRSNSRRQQCIYCGQPVPAKHTFT
ncbi:MAG TPA: hypothetical protein DCY13_13420 [Verrucomicrobiales bacterium]|nr:hypothetical protein [Verrucomicrobiales bacterium]